MTGFNVILSQDTIFDSSDVTLSYSKLASQIGVSDEFTAIFARYVRYDVTGIFDPSFPNVGGANFTFYTPEPSAALLLGLSALLLRRRGGSAWHRRY